MLGMGTRIGSLTPGKQADIMVMSLGPLAMWPVHVAVATVVMLGAGARVRDVLVAVTFRKRDGKLLWNDLGKVRSALVSSGERILAELKVPTQSLLIAAH